MFLPVPQKKVPIRPTQVLQSANLPLRTFLSTHIAGAPKYLSR